MAHETLKTLILIKLPKRQTCPPQVKDLLAQLDGLARMYNQAVASARMTLSPEDQKKLMKSEKWLKVEQLLRNVLVKLRENGVNLHGFELVDFCDAFAEVHKAYASGH